MSLAPHPDRALRAPSARSVPRAPGLEHTARFLRDPYRFISRACAEAGSDVVQLRLMLQPTLCFTGAAAAELFQDARRFTRAGGACEPVRITQPDKVDALVAHAEWGWQALLASLHGRERFTLYGAVQIWLTRAACAWAGVPLGGARHAQERTQQLVALFDPAASGWRAHWQARRARREAEQWLGQLVEASRRGQEPGFPRHSLAWEAARLRDREGELLAPRSAAVELLNLLRPAADVAVAVVLAAHALYTHQEWQTGLRAADEPALRAFLQEVRRFYPLFPAVGARVRQEFEWRGWRFRAGTRALLDLYGTHRDPRVWDAPDEFQPERFHGREPEGRWLRDPIAWALTALAVRKLAGGGFVLPPQDLAIDFSRVPALPQSRMVLAPGRTSPVMHVLQLSPGGRGSKTST